MKYDQLVNSILQEQHFGGNPHEQLTGIKRHVTFEETEEDFISQDEAKAMQNMLNQQIADRRGGKKKSALQMVDVDQLSDTGKEIIRQMDKAVEMYQRGSAIGGDASLRSLAPEMEDEIIMKAFGKVDLDYIGWDKGSGLGGAHLYRYPATGGGVVGIPHDKDGFRIEAQMEGDKEDTPPEVAGLFPISEYDLVNFFAKGSHEPFHTVIKGRGAAE